jgi:serine/threonine-protein kinase
LLAQVATVDLVPALIRRLTNQDETMRLAMTRTLAHFDTEDVRQVLMGLLTDPHAPVRQAALEGLSRHPDLPLDVAPVCRLLQDNDRTVRRQAMTLLAQRKDPQIVAYLFDILRDMPAEMSQSAVELLQTVGNAEAVKAAVTMSKDPTHVRDVLLNLLTDARARVRNLALVGVAYLGVPFDMEPVCQLFLPFLLESLQDASSDVQRHAVTILNALGTTPILKALLGTLQGKEWWAMARVIEALGKHGTARVIAATLPLVTDADARLRRTAVDILKLRQDEQVVQALVQALEHANPGVRACAAEALAALGDKRAVPVLLHIAAAGAPTERVMALRTLTALGEARALPVCLEQVSYGPVEVQQEAVRALATLTDAEHAEPVLQAVRAVQATATEPALKALADGTARALMRRFGVPVVADSPAITMDLSRIATPSLLREVTDDQEPQAEAVRGVDSILSPLPTGRAPKPRLDITALEPGMVLGERYRVIRPIGQGGFGTVVLVEDLMVHEQLILKFLFPHLASDERMMARFIHELRYARRVSHENVIRIHDFLKIDQACAISMEYFPSQSLSDELRHQAPLALPRGLWIAFHVCSGMQAAHQAQIIHRDLKPPNILINDAGLVKIVDFGLAAVSDDTASRLTKTGALLGTPLYMAPEQVQNSTIDARVDIYSLGIIMYEIFTGTPPYTGANPMAVLFQHVAGKATPPRDLNPAIPQPLEAIILQAMAAEPDQRFQTMDALKKRLTPLLKQYIR